MKSSKSAFFKRAALAILAIFGGLNSTGSARPGPPPAALAQKESASVGAQGGLNSTISDEVAQSLGNMYTGFSRRSGGRTPKQWGMSDACYRMVRNHKSRAHRAGRSTAKFQLAH